MKSAVILAAGQGTRLREVAADFPKGFLKLGARPIVEESIARLIAAGIGDIVIVTGYRAEHYDVLAQRFDGIVRTVYNPLFADSGSMYSLYCAREVVQAPFFLLESDLIYEQRALDVLSGHPSTDAILLAGPSHAGDEVYVESRGGTLFAMSKDRTSLGETIAGELVGISKISQQLFALMIRIAEPVFGRTLRYDYETDCLVAAARTRSIACPVVDDLLWAEIDDADHFARARDVIYPAIDAVAIG